MADQDRSILVDKDLRPAYYDDFHCLAAGCRLSCCKGWAITFNKKDFLSLKRQKGSLELNERLETGVRRIRRGPQAGKAYGEFTMDAGVCPFLGEDCLCTLQVEKGHESLPYVCRSYPRTETYMMSGCLERSLSPSCEGVLALLWDLPEGIVFRSDLLPQNRHKRVNPVGEGAMPLWFPVVREWCVDLLQNRRFILPHRIWLMGLGLKELADGEIEIERWMERAAALPHSIDPSQMPSSTPKEQAMVLTGSLRTLFSLQSGDPAFPAMRQALLDALPIVLQIDEKKMDVPTKAYKAILARYKERFKDGGCFMENLMVCVFFHLHMPHMNDKESLWKSYVNFCNLYSFYRFMAVMSCREGVDDSRAELFKLIVLASRALIHDSSRQGSLRDEFFKNESATLAHMAILLGG